MSGLTNSCLNQRTVKQGTNCTMRHSDYAGGLTCTTTSLASHVPLACLKDVVLSLKPEDKRCMDERGSVRH